MRKTFGINRFIMDSGERYCLVIDRSSGLPSYYPNLYLTTQVRNISNAFSTMEAAASHLVVFLCFLDKRDIDLQQRVLTKQFMSVNELDDLRDFTQCKQSKSSTDSVHFISKAKDTRRAVNSGTQYARLTVIASYLKWLSNYLLGSAGNDAIDNKIAYITEQIKARRPKKRGRNDSARIKTFSSQQVETLFEIVRPGSEHNPFTVSLQRRNRLMILLLYHLGIRGGELLNIRIQDVDFRSEQLEIVRRSDEKSDSRIREPNVKTLGRILPLSSVLIKELHDYVIHERRKIKNAAQHDFLFVTHKEGPTLGNPISKSAYHKVISIVSYVSPELYAMTGHKLRHTWNRCFSEKMDAMDMPPAEPLQEQLRSFIMGWKPGSGTAAIYNRRFIEQKGYDAALAMQQVSGIRLPKGIENEHE